MLLYRMFNTVNCKCNCNPRCPTVTIGILHLVLLIFRIYEIAMDVYLLEDLIEINQVTYLILITTLQLIIVASLFYGAIKEIHTFLLPWLCFTAPIFVMATSYAILYTATGDYVQTCINFLVIGIFWAAWYLVLCNYLNLKEISTGRSYASCKYSRLFGLPQSSSIENQEQENLKEIKAFC